MLYCSAVRLRVVRLLVAPALFAALPLAVLAQGASGGDPLAAVPMLNTILVRAESDLAPIIERFSADQQSLSRRYDATDSPDQRRRMRGFAMSWRTRLKELAFDKLNAEGKADYVLLDNHLKHQIAELERQDKKRSETAALLPFADRLLALQDTRRNLVTVEPTASARVLAQVMKQVDSMRVLFETAPAAGRGVTGGAAPTGVQADSAARPRAIPRGLWVDSSGRACQTDWKSLLDGHCSMLLGALPIQYAWRVVAKARTAQTLLRATAAVCCRKHPVRRETASWTGHC